MPASSAFLPRRIPQKTKRRVLSTVDGSNHIRVRYCGPFPPQSCSFRYCGPFPPQYARSEAKIPTTYVHALEKLRPNSRSVSLIRSA